MEGDISHITGAITVVIAVFGSVGNFLTLFVIVRHRPLHDITGMFLANLAMADLLQSSFGMPLIAATAFHNSWIFGDTLCVLSGVTNSLFCITSMLTLSAIGVDRWLVIVYPLRHQTLLTFPRARMVLLYIWGQALLVALLPVFGWSRYIYLSYEFICTVQWEFNKPYTIFLCVTSFVTPLIVTVLCYASVMKVACHQARERPTTTVGEIEAEHSYMTTYNDIPDVNSSVTQSGQFECKLENASTKRKRSLSINLASGLSRTNPAHSRTRCTWTVEDPFGSKLGIISEENEEIDLQEDQVAPIKARTTSLGQLARMRERVAVRSTNKEKFDSILNRKKDMKILLTLLVVNGTFILCWLPHFIGILCLTFTNGSCPFPDSFFTITTTLAMLNSGCNPFIYTLTYRKFRKAFKRVFPWLRSSRIRNINSSID